MIYTMIYMIGNCYIKLFIVYTLAMYLDIKRIFVTVITAFNSVAFISFQKVSQMEIKTYNNIINIFFVCDRSI